ncbi:MAG TPA: methionine adenosyltransferase [Flavobacteriales bacterium]|nr:methionine adenosyltransferase [Flavobacteriales bacterium]
MSQPQDHNPQRPRLFTSESVSEGHPDKVADTISDALLDAYLKEDPQARVACETLCKKDQVVLAGEVSAKVQLDHEAIARETIRRIGYTDPATHFHADGVKVLDLIGAQAREIAEGITQGEELGAGDQGLMFGYATDETESLMPLPIVLAHQLTAGLATARRNGTAPWLRPDNKAQVTIRYEGLRPVAVDTVVVSTQHAGDQPVAAVQEWLRERFIPEVLGPWWHAGITVHANPAGAFVEGGPEADCGLTGRKIIVDTYGGMARHGGGAFSGKDATKVDRSAAYFARWVARRIVQAGLAKRAELQVCYAIGVAQPVALHVDTFGTGDQAAAEQLAATFDYRPQAIIEQLGLREPIYGRTTNYGHFGKEGLPWEE